MVKETFRFGSNILNIENVSVEEDVDALFATNISDEHLVSGIQPGESVEVTVSGEELDDGDLEPGTDRIPFTAPEELGEYEVIVDSTGDNTSGRDIFDVIRPEDGIIQPVMTRSEDWNLPTSLFTDLQFAFRPLDQVPKDARRQLGIPLEPLDTIELGKEVTVDDITIVGVEDGHEIICPTTNSKTQAPIDITVMLTVDFSVTGSIDISAETTLRVFEGSTRDVVFKPIIPEEVDKIKMCCDPVDASWVI